MNRRWLWLLTLISVMALLGLQKFENALVFDDVFVIGGDLIHDPSRIGEVFVARAMIAQGNTDATVVDTYRPITLITFFWDAWLSGKDPWSYHLTNLIGHLATTIGLFFLLMRALPAASLPIVTFVSLFFGISPQLAEAHVWINGRSDIFAGLFGILTLIIWHGKGTGTLTMARAWLAGATFLTGLLCKEVLLLGLPAILFWPPHASVPFWKRFNALLPLVGAAAVYLGCRMQVLGGMRAAYGRDQALTGLLNLPLLWADAMIELVLPSKLYLRSMRDEYQLITTNTKLALGVAAVLTVLLLLRLRRSVPFLTWGTAWFMLTLAPVGIITTLLWPGFGRYLYIPCIGLALGLCEALVRLSAAVSQLAAKDENKGRNARRGVAFLAVIYLLSLAARFSVASQDYANNDTLYGSAAARAPKPAYALTWLAWSKRDEGKIGDSLRLLQAAVRLEPGEPRYLKALISSYAQNGRWQEAEALARSGIGRAPPRSAGDIRALLVYLLASHDPTAAVKELCTCLDEQPQLKECLEAPKRLLDPRGPMAGSFRQLFANFPAVCPSRSAQKALASSSSATPP